MMPLIFINGFPPKYPNVKVTIYDEGVFNTAQAQPIWEGIPDKAGAVSVKFDKSWMGKRIRVVTQLKHFRYKSCTFEVERLGVFHTFEFEADRAAGYTQGRDDLIFPSGWTVKSQREKSIRYRNARYHNPMMFSLVFLLTLLSCYVFPLTPLGIIDNIILSSVLSAIITWLSDYSEGIKPGV